MGDRYPLIHAARAVVDEVNRLVDRPPGRRLLHTAQLREAVQSIAANIREALGRRGPERENFLRFARGSAEETDEHLRANFAARRLPAGLYWRLHHRLTLIIKILRSLSTDRDSRSS